VERCPNRDQRVISRSSCPYCCHFIALVFTSTSLSRVWVANVRPAVVLFYNPALLVHANFPPSVLCRTTAPTEHHLYLIVLASGSHLLSPFPTIITRRCLFSLSSPLALALGLIVCAYYFFRFLTPFVVYIFYPTLFPYLCLYSPLTFVP